jgi:hypothetical protein
MSKFSLLIFRFLNLRLILYFFIFQIAAPSNLYAGEEGEKVNVCVECHQNLEDTLKDAVTNWQESIHKKAGVYCNECHGGDPYDYESSKEAVAGYIGIPKPKNIPMICSRCHSDIKMMRKYNLKTDQLNLYKTSIHGMRLFEKGDEAVATCVSCHGNHNILSKNDPRSPVYRFNVPLTCGKCHSNKEMTKPYNISTNQYDLYKRSHHGRLLFENKNLSVPTCVDCHGTHGAAPPGMADITEACGSCHAVIAEYFKKSPHLPGVKEGMPRCITCHGNHDIQRPTIAKFTGTSKQDCGGCHLPDSPAFKVGDDIKTVLMEAENSYRMGINAVAAIREWGGSGFATGYLEDDMDKAKIKLTEAYSITHTLSVKEVKVRASEAVSLSKNVGEIVEGMIEETEIRKIGLVFTWIAIAAISMLLWLKAKDWKRNIKVEK